MRSRRRTIPARRSAGLGGSFPLRMGQVRVGAPARSPVPTSGSGFGHTWCLARSSALDQRMRSPGRIAPPHRRQVVAKLAVRWKTATQSPLLRRDTRRSGRSRGKVQRLDAPARGARRSSSDPNPSPGGTCRFPSHR